MAVDRVETGPVRIGDDRAGVFIRGDDAAGLACLLDRFGGDPLDQARADQYAAMLRSCNEPSRAVALRRAEPEQEVEGLVADVVRCIPAPGAVCVEGFPRKATNVLVSVDLLERVIAALRARSPRGEEGSISCI